MRKLSIFAFLLAVALDASAHESMTSSEAAKVFRLAQSVCAADGGGLWGRSLCGPMLLVDAKTRTVFSNQPDAQGNLKAQGEIFVGQLPSEINVANTALDWSGVRWTMLMLPLPRERELRRVLLAHEMWHRVQNELGFEAAEPSNDHLDTREGRYWLQLEWRALGVALRTSGAERAAAMRDAMTFRARRREIFPSAVESERALEMNEGLAEYTGVKLGVSGDQPRFVFEHELAEAPQRPSFVRSFAYATGPSYGLLLDSVKTGWRKTLRKEDDFAGLLAGAINFALPPDLAATAAERAENYGGSELAKSETARERDRTARAADYRARLVQGTVLRLPLQKMNMQFDPGRLVPLDTLGTVYPTIRIVDEWGILTVARGGALLNADFTSIAVPVARDAKTERPRGDGWTLELKPGWEFSPAVRKGDYTIRRKE